MPKKKNGNGKPTLFDFLNQIFYKTDKHEYDKSIANAYILSMSLSLDDKLIDIVNEINHLQYHLKDDIIYEYYKYKVPRGKRWIPWVKKSAKDKKMDEKIELLMGEKSISKREATEVVKFMEKL